MDNGQPQRVNLEHYAHIVRRLGTSDDQLQEMSAICDFYLTAHTMLAAEHVHLQQLLQQMLQQASDTEVLMARLRTHQGVAERANDTDEVLTQLDANLKKQHTLASVTGTALGQALSGVQNAKATILAYPFLPVMSPTMAEAIQQYAKEKLGISSP